MKLEPLVNSNYAALIVRIPAILSLEGADNLVGIPLYGFQALVDKTHTIGELGVMFPAECQLSDDYCRFNNLYRHEYLNIDPEEKGYFEDNRRVKAIKLRGHRSDCLFMPLSSLSFFGADPSDFQEGDLFDHIGKTEICRKYQLPIKGNKNTPKSEKKFIRVDPKFFPLHIETENYFRNKHLIPDDAYIYVSQKLHGSSVRLGHIQVLRKLSWRDSFAKRLGVKVQEHEYDKIAGSRKVVKDPIENPNKQDYYESDIWCQQLRDIEDLIPENYIIYGEVIGYTTEGQEIQTEYTYNLPPKTNKLFVYRVAMVNPRGLLTDLSWPQVKEFCFHRNLNHVPELWEGRHSDFKAEDWLDKRYHNEGFAGALSLGNNKKLVDEGVCVRMDKLTPVTLKVKSPIFLQKESKDLDKGIVTLEDIGSEEE